MEKRAVDFKIKSASVGFGTSSIRPEVFEADIRRFLDEGWDVFSAASIGVDTGGGQGGNSSSLMMVVTLVKYGYFDVEDVPSKDAQNEPPQVQI